MRLLVVIALVMFTALPTYAQTETTTVGTLLGAEGLISRVAQDGKAEPLKLNAPVHMNDVIETGAGARAFILLIDNTELTLGENAQLTIDEYVFDEEKTAANKGHYSILRGAFLYTSGLIAKKENPDVTVQTPFGVIGIRGTTFWGGYIDDEYGILVTEGRVSVQTDRGRLFVDQGQGTSLRSKTAIPARAGVWPEEKINRAVQTIALKDAEGVRERVGQQADKQIEKRLEHKEFLQQRQDRIKQDNAPSLPTKRIDNVPRPVEKTEAAPAPSPASKTENVDRPFNEETRKTGTAVEPLLKAAPTNAPAKTTPALDKQLQQLNEDVKDKGANTAPVATPNEAHAQELKEQDHLQNRQPQPPTRSKAAGAL